MQDHIKITNTPPRVQYVGDGVQREFFFPFAIFKPEHVEVFVGDSRLTGGMSVEGAGESAGGSVFLDQPPGVGALVTVRRRIAIERTTDFQPAGAFSARLINDELDYLTAALQQVAADAEASLHLDATEPSADMTLPAAPSRAGRVLAFDDDGRPLAASKDEIAAAIRHGAVRELGNDDHPQYLTSYRANAWLSTHSLDDLREGVTVKRFTSADRNKLATVGSGAEPNPPTVSDQEKRAPTGAEARTFSPRDIAEIAGRFGGGSGGGIHGLLTGLDADDHPQYLSEARADGWLAGKTADDVAAGTSNRYMTLAGSGIAANAARADHDHAGLYEPAFAKNSAFNRNFGPAAGDVAPGDHGHDAAALASGVLDPARLPLAVGDAGSGGTAGCVPAPAPGDAAAGKFLAADATWRVPAMVGGVGRGVAFPASPEAGDTVFRTDLGCLFFYDGSRGKWLGELESDGAGYNGDHANGYLRRYNGCTMSPAVGIYIPYDITVVGLSMAWVGAQSGNVQVVRNGVTVGTVAFSPATTAVATMNLNTDFAGGGVLAFSTGGHSGAMTSPQLRCWWRRRAG
ncbi:MAG: hypothetical protein JNM75_02840 [Rhodospirillales bacterium]|nr:hypothetical protein [Rhodospirillales bacterium]